MTDEINARGVTVAREWLQNEAPGARSIWPGVLGFGFLFLCSALPFVLAIWVKP